MTSTPDDISADEVTPAAEDAVVEGEATVAEDAVLGEPDPVLIGAHDLALAALHEITPASTIGAPAEYRLEADGVVSLRFENRLAGYPGWYWTVSLARVEGCRADRARGRAAARRRRARRARVGAVGRAPRRVPGRAGGARRAGGADDDDASDDDDADDDLDDLDDLDAADFDDDGSPILHAGDVDGVDIDELARRRRPTTTMRTSDDDDESDDDSDEDDDDDDRTTTIRTTTTGRRDDDSR